MALCFILRLNSKLGGTEGCSRRRLRRWRQDCLKAEGPIRTRMSTMACSGDVHPAVGAVGKSRPWPRTFSTVVTKSLVPVASTSVTSTSQVQPEGLPNKLTTAAALSVTGTLRGKFEANTIRGKWSEVKMKALRPHLLFQ